MITVCAFPAGLLAEGRVPSGTRESLKSCQKRFGNSKRIWLSVAEDRMHNRNGEETE